ncbi:hypothetical protein HMF8227_00486 [Saliniradius amylolyticus]|uniref:Serine aminopeptidase S33 domain-containing protein n=1 Tax=Saliniradius amylolyticus TaxID=2183582 RepID=A0A2S2E0B8_9ALTE|nr:alpha/beta hydrolase [Saliniradius amylolyticus]AWL10982.1 hypothetical protein HMF8227_00486 [Saliniradius amylolyticus]
MNNGYQKYWLAIVLTVAVTLQGCAVDVTPENFIYQDKRQQPLDLKTIQNNLTETAPHAEAEVVSVTAGDGVKLSGLKMQLPQARANVLLYGGNGMTIAKAHKVLRYFARIPVNLVWFDYRGTGSSGGRGTLSIDQLKRDALITYGEVAELLPSRLPTFIHGLSMGSLIGAYVANNSEVSGLVLDGAIANVPELVERLSPAVVEVNLAPELAVIDNRQQLQQFERPLLLLVGEEDTTTPPEYAQSLYERAASESKLLVVIPEASHGATIKSDKAIQAYRHFLTEGIPIP